MVHQSFGQMQLGVNQHWRYVYLCVKETCCVGMSQNYGPPIVILLSLKLIPHEPQTLSDGLKWLWGWHLFNLCFAYVC